MRALCMFSGTRMQRLVGAFDLGVCNLEAAILVCVLRALFVRPCQGLEPGRLYRQCNVCGRPE